MEIRQLLEEKKKNEDKIQELTKVIQKLCVTNKHLIQVIEQLSDVEEFKEGGKYEECFNSVKPLLIASKKEFSSLLDKHIFRTIF